MILKFLRRSSPPEGVMKLNVDGATSGNQGPKGLTEVQRVEGTCFVIVKGLFWFNCLSMLTSWSPTRRNSWQSLKTLQISVPYFHHKLVLEITSLNVIS